jgi:2-polyprenyl-6-methoxyphenol hydroxylase-like FAD-dependent oxidoreductase
MPDGTRILIAGAGIGGLALAQALRRGGVDVTVYEKDPTPTVRNQGYRIHIDGDGNTALRACLAGEVLERVHATAGITNDLMAIYTPAMTEVMTQTFPIPDGHITHIDRNAFRAALLTGLDGVVEFGRAVTGYRTTATGGVRVDFADGGSEHGDLLIGADGVRSAIRAQLLPHAAPRDLGLRCVYGRMDITPATEPLVPRGFDRGFVWIADDGQGAGFAPMRFRSPHKGDGDYLMTTYLATQDHLGVPDDELFNRTPQELSALVADATAGWDPALRELFAHADTSTFFPIAISAGRRTDDWQAGPVTLLGDSVHLMPPTGGIGASTALQDAADLARELLAASHAGKPPTDAVAAYQPTMLERGFANIDTALANAGHMFTTGDHQSLTREPGSVSL